MLRSAMITMARNLTNDNDSNNPFNTDTILHSYIDDWNIDLSAYLKWPRASQTITFAVADGPDGSGGITNAKNLNRDIITILSIYFENTSNGTTKRLTPRNEAEIQSLYPRWRYNSNQAIPSYAVFLSNPTVGTVDWPQVTITVDVPTSEARTMRIHYVQAMAPSTAGANTPIFMPQFHKSGVYFISWQAMVARNAQKALYFEQLYLKERAKQKALVAEQIDPVTEIWDMYQIPGYPQQNVLIR